MVCKLVSVTMLSLFKVSKVCIVEKSDVETWLGAFKIKCPTLCLTIGEDCKRLEDITYAPTFVGCLDFLESSSPD
jgi:hypothetical protein